MTVQIEEGKEYRSRDGERWRNPQRGVITDAGAQLWILTGPGGTQALFEADGCLHSNDEEGLHGFDLVAEWGQKRARTLETLALLKPEPVGQQKQEPAWKEDGGKPRLDLIAPEFIMATADILAFGANKYAPRNWEKGMSWGRCFGALMRHMWAWWGGEKADAETGKSHLWHAACCLMFLIAYEERNIGIDDRKAEPEKNLS